MLQYNSRIVGKIGSPPVGAPAAPFPGRYPTRVYSSAEGWSYLGKPTPNAWRQIVRHTWVDGFGPWFVEFDRAHVVRKRVGPKIAYTALMPRYYSADKADFAQLARRDYYAFEPLRLREGVIYFRKDWMARHPEWTLDDWYVMLRNRLRGKPCKLFEPEAVAAPEVPEDNHEARQQDVEKTFYRILGVDPERIPNGPRPRFRLQQPAAVAAANIARYPLAVADIFNEPPQFEWNAGMV